MSVILPFDTFLEILRAKGYSITLHEHFAVARLLERWDRTDVGELRDALAAVIGRNDEEVDGIRRLFDEVNAPPPAPAAPQPIVQPRVSFPWLWASVATAGVVLAGALAFQTSAVVLPPVPPAPAMQLPEALSPIPVTPNALPVAPPPGVTNVRRRPTVSPAVPDPPPLPSAPVTLVRSIVAESAAAAFLLAFASLWRFKAYRSTRRWLHHAWRSTLAALPGPFQPDLVVRGMTWKLARLDLEDAALILGRIYGTDTRTRELDARESLRLTLKHGLLPHLVFKRVHAAGPILVLEDVSFAMDLWREKVHALLRDLVRQGIPLERWYFDGDPRHLSEKQHGALTSFQSVVGRRPDSPVLVLSTGEGLAPVFAGGGTSWLQAFKQCPRRVWVTPIGDSRLWPDELSRVPVHVWPMTRYGLTQAARELAGFDTTRSIRARVLNEGRVALDDVERLKRLASLVPHPTIELLELLRRRFTPDVPDAALAYLFRESGSDGLRVLRMSDEEVKRCAAAVRRESPTLEAAVRQEIVTVLRDSAPQAGSAAHLRWQMAVAIQELSIAQLRTTDASAPVAMLRKLEQGPLWQEVAAAVGLLPAAEGTEATSSPAAQFLRTRRTAPPPDNGQLVQRMAKPRFRPGVRELVPAVATTVGLCLAAWALNVFPTRTLAHVPNAYALSFASNGAPRQLELRAAGAMSPRTVDLYRGGQLLQGGLSIPADAPLSITVPPDGTGNYYQARAGLPDQNLALSNPLWMPSSNLLVVLIDAQPWARVTIDGNGMHLEPGATPFSVPLAPGTYSLQLENGNITPPREEMITVAPGNQEFRFVMPGFDPNQTATDLLRSP